MCATSRCRCVVDARRRGRAGAPLVWPEATGNIACEDPPRRRGGDRGSRSRRPRTSSRSTSSTSGWRRARSSRAPRSRATTRRRTASRCASTARRPRACATSCAPTCSASPTTRCACVVGDVGGGFGMKTTLYAEDVVARVLRAGARAAAEVVRRAHRGIPRGHARARPAQHAKLALDEDGRILALRIDSLANLGAYATPAGVVIQLMIGPWVSTSIYDIDTIDIRIKAVLTNTTPTGPIAAPAGPRRSTRSSA